MYLLVFTHYAARQGLHALQKVDRRHRHEHPPSRHERRRLRYARANARACAQAKRATPPRTRAQVSARCRLFKHNKHHVHQASTDRQKKLTDDLVGVCMSEYGNMFTKDLTRTNTLAGMVGEVMTHIRHAKKTWMHEYVVHNWDAALSYAYGIVTGMMDVAQVADWSHCKMPSLVNADVSECVW